MPGPLVNEGYPAVPGHQPWTICDIAGPASYVAVVTNAGGAPTGGQLVNISALGFPVNVLWAQSMGSDNAQFDIVCFLSPFQSMQPSQNIILQWITAATGAEVAPGTNLSGRTVRLIAVGR